MNMQQNGKARAGFTLMELLAVIGIIAVLAALLIPALSLAKGHARSATCKNRLHQIGLGMDSYVNDHDHNYPPAVNPFDHSLDDVMEAANTRYWWAKLQPYYPVKWTSAEYHCPGYKGAVKGEEQPQPPFGSYAYNEFGAAAPYGEHRRYGLGPAIYGLTKPPPLSENRVRVPSDMLAVSESRFLSEAANHEPGGVDYLVCGFLAPSPPGDHVNIYAFDPAQHGKNYNILFCDGHIGAMTPRTLFNPTNSAAMWNYDHEPHPESWVSWP